MDTIPDPAIDVETPTDTDLNFCPECGHRMVCDYCGKPAEGPRTIWIFYARHDHEDEATCVPFDTIEAANKFALDYIRRRAESGDIYDEDGRDVEDQCANVIEACDDEDIDSALYYANNSDGQHASIYEREIM